MPIELTMMENGRIAFFKFTDPWTADDVVQINHDEMAVLEHTPTLIHTIADLTGCKHLPEKLLQLRHLPTLTHKMMGYRVMIGAPSPMKQIGRVLGQLTGNLKIVYVDTVDEAWAFIREKMTEEDRVNSH